MKGNIQKFFLYQLQASARLVFKIRVVRMSVCLCLTYVCAPKAVSNYSCKVKPE